MNHTHRLCRWFVQDRLGHDPGRANRLIEWSANRADFPGLPPVLTVTLSPAVRVDKAANPSKCLAALFLILGYFFS